MAPRYPRRGPAKRTACGRALRGRALAAAEQRAGLDARAAGVLAGGQLVAARAHDARRDRAAVGRHDEPVAVDLHDLPRRGARVAVDALGVEDLDLLAADRRPCPRPRVRAADEVVDVADGLGPVDLRVGF